MAELKKAIHESAELRLVAYPGDNTVLLAMSLADGLVSEEANNLAGFAIWRRVPGGEEKPLLNRLAFDKAVTRATTPKQRKWTPSPEAPFQKFRWIDVPPEGFDKPIRYRVVARYFTGQGAEMRDGPSAEIEVEPANPEHASFRVAFTRGYASSQAYADKFHNKDIRPKGAKKPAFDTAPFKAQYEWLGAQARRVLFQFLDDCRSDKQCKVDVFAYDLDEPDVIAAVCELGREGRLRAVLDDASLHTKAEAVEPKAAKLIETAAGKKSVVRGHFGRFQHHKVFLKRNAQGDPVRALFGSMNFSLRGLYVQANNVMRIDDPAAAKLFGDAFDNAFANGTSPAAFKKIALAAGYNPISKLNTLQLPESEVAFSPHKSSTSSLGPMQKAIRGAKSSVLYAVMEPKGSGPVLEALRGIAAKPTIFSYGTVETDKGLAVQNPDGAMGKVTGYAYLKGQVPAPFVKEWSGGAGKHIHHKFVVVDFNGNHPVVFTGSSNLAAGGEEQNGDSLIAIRDPLVAGMYAVEAVRLFDHYHFRKNMAAATKAAPLSLWYPGKPKQPMPWWKPYYDPKSIKLRDRLLFADLPVAPSLRSSKKPDWAGLKKRR
jgi:phosphatidylserine/phosphatidylglycerophosphate/cardiolipin synthase-like enzyme